MRCSVASFLHPCANGCGKMIRTKQPVEERTICDPCKAAIAGNEAAQEKARASAKPAQPSPVKRPTKG